MLIPDDKVEEVKSATDIVDVVSDYVRLKKAGSNFKGLCPFHNEKTPSFNVNPSMGIFKCFGCLEENERVWMHRGLRPIREVRVGDRVLGIDGSEEVVVAREVKPGRVIALELDPLRRDPLRLTPDHTCAFVRAEDALRAVPMLYRQAGRGVRFQGRKRSYEVPRACPIREAEAASVRPGDYFLFPVIPDDARADVPLPSPRRLARRLRVPVETVAAPGGLMPTPKRGRVPVTFDALPVDEETARFYGLWLAEGSCYRGGVRWSFHRDEEDLAAFVVEVLQSRFGLAASIHRRPERTQLEVTCSNTHLSFLFPQWFGRGAAHKRVPYPSLFWSRPAQRALLRGYLEGDGHRLGEGQWRAKTVSPDLARGLFALAVQAGLPPVAHRDQRPTTGGHVAHEFGTRARESASGFFYPIDGRDYYWMRVRSAEPEEGARTVVDLMVTGTHTFTTKAGAVHNCGEGGDAISFVMKVEGTGFTETVRMLAEQAGIELPAEGARDPHGDEKESILHALRFAARWYYEQLTQSDVGRQRGLGYFESRGLAPETIKKFGLGFAPDAWDGLLRAAEAAQIKPETLDKAGLVLPNNNRDGFHDRFRERVMFPIFSHVGKVLGFGGRVLPDSAPPTGDYVPPKYINSPETRVYHKSRVLYGLYQSKQAIRGSEEAILVEGYTDVISLYQAGVKNVVASSGTALTPEQVKALDRYAKRVLLLYDADSAGAAAALRGIDLILRAGLAAYVVSLPDGADPDSFVQQFGGEAFRTFLQKERQSFVHFKVAAAKRAGALATPEGQAETARSVLESIAQIPDTVAQDGYIRVAAAELGVPDIHLRMQFRDVLKRGGGPRREPRYEAPPPEDEFDAGAPPPPETFEMKPEEGALLRLMLERGSPMVEHVLGHMALEEFSPGPVRETVTHLLEQYRQGRVDKTAFTGGQFGTTVQQIAAGVLVDRHAPSDHYERKGIRVPEMNAEPFEAAASAMTLLKLDRVNEAIELVSRRTYAAEQAGEDLTALQQRMQELQRLKMQIERREFFEWGQAEGGE
jgi:DNA primase